MSEDYGKHLMGVDDLLQKHSLLEADIHVLGERVKTVNLQAMKFVDGDFSEVGGNLTFFTDIRNKPSALLSAVVLYKSVIANIIWASSRENLTVECKKTKSQISLCICTV